MSFMIGENVGPYRLIEQLGQGGMATVYKAYHARLDRYVAIKALHPAFMQDPNFQARFQREARVVARLEHPNIVPIYDFAEHAGRPYLVLKYVKGETLKARLIRGAISQELIRDVFEAVSSALTYAHQQGVLHRDVKPSNVLLGQNGKIYLADFGLARIAQAGESTLSAEMMLGTPQYISPEQAKGVSDLDEGTDIYSLGVMMYELFVGKVPFNADTPFSIIHDHIYTPLPLPREVNPQISEELERVILKALSKAREGRYRDVPAMAEAFQNVFAGQKSAAVLPETGPEPVEESGSPVEPEPVLAAENERENDLSEAAGEEAEVDAPDPKQVGEKKRKVPGWVLWMGIPLLFILCLGGIVLKNALDPPNPEPVVDTLMTGESAVDQPETLLENREGEDLQGQDLEELLQKAKDHPEDPFVRMELSIRYWENEQPVRAEQAARKAVELAQTTPGLYFEFGNKYAEYGIWHFAVPNFIFAERHMEDPPEMIHALIEQAVYFAAFNEKSFSILRDPDLGLKEQTMRLIEARQAMQKGDFVEAERLINQVEENDPDRLVLLLMRADLHMGRGEFEVAEEILRELERRDDVPEWIKIEMDQFYQIIEENN